MAGNTANGMNTRNKILEAAILVFSENGFHGAGIKEITERAGVVRPSLYHYYGSKEGLYRAVHEFLMSDLSRFLDQRLNFTEDLVENLSQFVEIFEQYTEQYPSRLKILFQSALIRSGKDLEEVRSRFFPVFKGFLDRAFEASGVELEPEPLALYLGFLQNHVFHIAMGSTSPMENFASTQKVFEFLANRAVREKVS